MEAWQKAFLEAHKRSKRSPIMLTLFDQETAERNYAASIDREARVDERLINIRSLMGNMHLSAQDAMTALSIPASQQSIYAAQL